MKKTGEAHVQSQKSRQEQDLHKRYWHGRVCPQCKEFVIQYSDAVVAYRILPGIENILQHGPSVIYRKPNWGIVCSEGCRTAVRRRFENPVEAFKLLRYIQGWKDPKIPVKPKDGYRERVLKAVGIDPEINWRTQVYDTDDWLAGLKEFQLAEAGK